MRGVRRVRGMIQASLPLSKRRGLAMRLAFIKRRRLASRGTIYQPLLLGLPRLCGGAILLQRRILHHDVGHKGHAGRLALLAHRGDR